MTQTTFSHIRDMRERAETCGPFWYDGLPKERLAKAVLELADWLDELEDKFSRRWEP